jgi:CSLREA domain-containing protein
MTRANMILYFFNSIEHLLKQRKVRYVQVKPNHLISILLFIMGITCSGSMSYAATINVNTTADENGSNSSRCSLREAVTAANTNRAFGGCIAGGDWDVIRLTTSGTYKLPNGMLTITSALKIDGIDRASRTINGEFARRIFNIDSTAGYVEIFNLTMANGNADTGGGAIFIRSAEVYLKNTVIRGCTVVSGGGGIYGDRAVVTVEKSLIQSNTGGPRGGGIWVTNGSFLFISQSTIEGNTASNGAGITATSSNSSVHIQQSTISGNKGSIRGGGIQLSGGRLEIYDTTITKNSTEASITGGTSVNGGGIWVGSGAFAQLSNSILADNISTSGYGRDCQINSGTIVSNGFNLIGSAGIDGTAHNCGVTPTTGDSFGTRISVRSARLNDLTTTFPRVHVPRFDSEVIDTGSCPGGFGIDQLGVERPRGAACDKGSIEY